MIIVNGWKPLTIITKHSILDVAAALDLPLGLFLLLYRIPQVANGGRLEKKLFLKIPQNSQENTCSESLFLIMACNFVKKETLTQVFPVNFANFKTTYFIEPLRVTAFLRTPVLNNICERLLLLTFRERSGLFQNLQITI